MSKKEFNAGDEVWCIDRKGIVFKTGYYRELPLLVAKVFHTPEELLENIKQQIDELDRQIA